MNTVYHTVPAGDAAILAAMRAARPSGPLDLTAPQAPARFDAMIAAVPAAPGVRYEAASVGGIPGWWCRPERARSGACVLFLHGGGYLAGSAGAFRHFAGHIAQRGASDTFIADYRLAPAHPFPAAFDDALAAYLGLAALGMRRIALCGDSAGGGLALALLSNSGGGARLCGAAVMSPWTDLALRGASMASRAAFDPVLTRAALAAAAACYLAGADANDPRASPLQADLAGLPPVRIDVGGDEILLDDARRYAAAAQAAGNEVLLAEWDGMPHVFASDVGALTAADLALDAIGAFLAACLAHGA